MKKVLRFSGLVAAILAVVSFVLLLACPSLSYSNGSLSSSVDGTTAIFGSDTSVSAGSFTLGSVHTSLAWTALLAWIFVVVALVILLLGVILPLLKVTALDKFAGVLNLVAVILLVVAGVLTFCTKPAFFSANGVDSYDGWALGVGWIISGIVSIVAGVLAILPAVFDFIAKEK